MPLWSDVSRRWRSPFASMPITQPAEENNVPDNVTNTTSTAKKKKRVGVYDFAITGHFEIPADDDGTKFAAAQKAVAEHKEKLAALGAKVEHKGKPVQMLVDA